MSYQLYKVLHLSSIVAFFILMAAAATDGRKTKFRVIGSGVALLLALVGGFGLMARLGIPHNAWPTWIIGKLVIFLVVGSLGHILLKRAPHLMRKYMVASFILFVTATWLANYKI